MIDNFSKNLWSIPPENKNSQTLPNEFSKILSTSRRSLVKLGSDRVAEFYNCNFQKFLESKQIQHYSQFTDKGPSIPERVIRRIRNLFKKPVFLARKASWTNEPPSVFDKCNHTIHHSIKVTPIEAFKKSNEKKSLQISKIKDLDNN